MYDKEDYEESISVVGLYHESRQKEIKDETTLEEVRSKKHKGKGKNILKPESSTQRGH
jgi:hypothetical protein